MTRVLPALLCAFATAAFAQAVPDENWGTYQPKPPPPPVATDPGLPPPPPPPMPSAEATQPLAPRSTRASTRRTYVPEVPNTVSMMGAPTLGNFNRGELITLGFPLISLRFLVGLGDRFDLGIGFDSFYTVMNEPLLVARLGLYRGERWSFSATFDGGYAWFTVRAPRETKGARWLTGRRNINLSPALVASYQGSHPRAARLFFEARYLLAFDTEPFANDPLAGVPPAFVVGHNVALRGGAELPLSSKTSFLFMLGFDIHGRDTDAVVMPQVAVGVTTSL